MVPPRSDRISRVPPYSRTGRSLRVRGCHPLWPAFPDRSAYPRQATGLFHFRSPLLAESLLMSIPPGIEMFQFPGFAPPAYLFSRQYPKGVGCPIRISTDQRLLAAPHGFSQRATSFIASWCQGIHRMPLLRSITRAPAAPTKHGGHPIMRRNHPRTTTRQNPGNPLHRHSRAPVTQHTHIYLTVLADITPAAPSHPCPLSTRHRGRAADRSGVALHHPSVRNAITLFIPLPLAREAKQQARAWSGKTSPKRRAQRRTRT